MEIAGGRHRESGGCGRAKEAQLVSNRTIWREDPEAARRRPTPFIRAGSLLIALLGLTLLLAIPAYAHEGEASVPAITDVQEAVAILASQPELMDNAMDKVGDALESSDTRGVRLDLVRQAQAALDANQIDQALTLLERSIGACPGAPVLEPQNAPRTPPPLSSPCPSPASHLLALDRSPLGGAKEPALIAVGAVLILGGLGLARRIR
jgi:hypothetical protein